MTKPAKPPKNEKLRLELLKQLMVLDSESEPLFDEITKLASQICGTPIALISLVDENRQWFKANIGLEGASETHRDLAFCAHAILENNLFEINDATQDDRFQNNPLVTSDPNIRFYAGMPLTMANGLNIGTLCVIDREPRSLSQEQRSMLAGLAEITCKALLSREKNIYELHDKAELLAAIIDSSNDAIVSKTLGGIITSWNIAAEQIFGYKSKEMIGNNVSVLFPANLLHEEDQLISKVLDNQSISHFESTRLTKNKQIIQVSTSLSPIKNAQGEIVGVSTIMRDITQTKQLQQNLALEHERLRVTMDSIGDAVITTDKAGKVQYLNPVAEDLTGWSLHDALGQPIAKVFSIAHETTRQRCLNPVELCLSENKVVGLAQNTVLISRNGKEYGIEDSAAPIRDQAGNTIGVVLVFHDVSEQRIMAREISYRASHDSLTGLYNRSEFESILNDCIHTPKAPDAMDALMILDLDRFKIVNDTCGHAAGDKLLVEITSIIKNCIRNNDTFARIGGDEFAILLEKCNIEKAYEIATLICQSVYHYRFIYKDKKFRVGTSIGLVVIDEHSSTTSEVLQAADNACYDAKSAGRNRVHLYHSSNPSLAAHKKETQWVNRIEQAIEENHFTLFCQRILPLNHIGKEHAEILLRLIDENGKIIKPNVFIPAAERFHMMSRIDRWVLKNAFEWLQKNDALLSHIDTISINLSGQSLGDKDFLDYVEQLISDMSLDCSLICFEITETVAITNLSNAATFFNQMKRYGIRLSLDDFGSGVSSFAYLKNLPVDYLKIDGQFIKDLIENQIGQATVKCMTEVARVTNKQTIAEWVDNTAVEKVLKEMGVDFTQGYLNHMPAPLDFLTKIKCEYMPENVA